MRNPAQSFAKVNIHFYGLLIHRIMGIDMINLYWVTKSNKGELLLFNNVDLSNITANGVYIIWHGGNPSRVVYVGQGDVAARLQAHRRRSDINAYSKYGALYVTWASVPAHQQNGVERYLAEKWSPLVGEAYPVAAPIVVNSPW